MVDRLNDLMAEFGDDIERVALPDWLDPMLATLTERRFSDENWLYERKFDGERCLAYRNEDQVQLYSRNQKSLNTQYPELIEALGQFDRDRFIVDGEIVAFEGEVTSFSRLQERMHVTGEAEAQQAAQQVAVFFYLFDILYLDGYRVTDLPLRKRKTLLKRAFAFADPIRYTPHRNRDGESFFEEACAKGWEGIIAKEADRSYIHSRSRSWLKFKCVNRQEFVIGGYTDPHGERIAFGALLVGYYQGDDLVYAGKVGTGYDDETLRRLGDQLESLQRKTPPFVSDDDLPEREVHWVTPKLVAQIGFEEWTDYGKLRQPRFQGLRDDKDPGEVVREEAGT